MGLGNEVTGLIFLDMYQKVKAIDDRTQSMEETMSGVKDALEAVQAQLDDAKSDILAKVAQLSEQVADLESHLGEVPADAAASLDAIKASIKELDEAVGDADHSDE